MIHLNITNKIVADFIATLDPSKAISRDKIPVVVLQKCSPEISPILCRLFKKRVAETCVPSCWKLTSFVPIFKNSGERSDPCNYHPISLLSFINKVFESSINSCITHHLDSHNLFSDHKYGFRFGRSTIDALTFIFECFYQFLDACNESRAIALGISKAFDNVRYAGLLHKMKSYGISCDVLNIITSLLSGRKMKLFLIATLQTVSLLILVSHKVLF